MIGELLELRVGATDITELSGAEFGEVGLEWRGSVQCTLVKPSSPGKGCPPCSFLAQGCCPMVLEMVAEKTYVYIESQDRVLPSCPFQSRDLRL